MHMHTDIVKAHLLCCQEIKHVVALFRFFVDLIFFLCFLVVNRICINMFCPSSVSDCLPH